MNWSDPNDNAQNQDRGRRLASYARAQVQRAARCENTPCTSVLLDSPPGYTLHREVHRGGQGVVFEANQHSTKRRVAVKIMHEIGAAGVRRQARFEREIEILAQLRHPNIVSVHDGGVTTGGRFYLAMDFVDGEPIDDFLASRELSVRDTVSLFLKVCDAVNAAHLRGVVHRDLKPGNIRVDRAGEPHVLDFGLAKIVEGESGRAASAMTMTGEFIGTLHWTSPEQAEGDQDRIDVRSDVYALGVLLFHALTDAFPYDVIGPMSKVLASICQSEPVKPSRFRTELDDDVDTIVLKCLNKQPERRYQNAGELAGDLRRYLEHKPIEAKRDSTLYVFGRLIRRKRGVVASIAALLLSLVVGLVVAVTLLVQVRAERDRANREFQKAIETRNLLTASFRLADPTLGPANVSARDVLDTAVLSVNRTDVDPVSKAILLRSIGSAYKGIGELETARKSLDESLEILESRRDEFPGDYVESLIELANLDLLEEKLPAALERFETSVRTIELNAVGRLDLVAKAKVGLGKHALVRGDAEAAIAQLEAACQLFESLGATTQTELLECQRDLAEARTKMVGPSVGRAQQEALVQTTRNALGSEHPLVARALRSVASTLREGGFFVDALRYEQEAFAIRENHLGPAHHETIESRHDLAWLLGTAAEYEKAEPHWREILINYRKTYGDSFWTGVAMINLGRLLHRQGKDLDESAQLFREAVAIAKTKNPERGPSELLERQVYLVTVLLDLDLIDEADEVSAELLVNARTKRDVEAESLAMALLARGEVLSRNNECEDAIPLLNESLELAIRHGLPARRLSTEWVRVILGDCLSRMGDQESAASQLDVDFSKALAEWRVSPRRRRDATQMLIAFHERSGDTENAQHWRNELTKLESSSQE